MKIAPFSISTDGSNDAEEKQFPMVVRTIDQSGLVQSELLSVPVCTEAATGENIYRLIETELNSRLIPWKNCLSLGCDNAPVMTGRHKGVYAFMREQQPQIYLSGCTLHMVHNAGKKAASVLPPIDTVLIDIYYFFNKSADRQRRFIGVQKDDFGMEQQKLLKHVCTRWLSIGRCLRRLLANWDPLKVFFKEEFDQLNKGKATSSYASSKVESIFTFLRSPTNQLYATFLLFAVDMLEPFLLVFQSEEPKIHILRRKIQELYRNILQKFIKPTVMRAENPIEEVDFKSSVNQRADQNLDIGEDARTMIENKKDHHLRDSRIKEFYSNVRQYYTTLMDYLLSHLPETKAPQMTEDDFDPRRLPFLAQLEIVDVEKQSAGYFSTLRHLVKTYPVLLPPGCHLNVLNQQFGVYQMSDMTQYKADRLDQTWANIGQDPILKLTELSLVMRGLLVIPHSSAHCERVFSCVRKVKTPQRSSLSLKTLESLLVLKNCDTEAVQNLPEDAIMPLKQAYSKKVHASKKL